MASTLSKQNIIIGAANVYLGPSDLLRPAVVGGSSYKATLDAAASYSVGVGTAVTSWKNVGYTQEGLELSYEPDYGDVEVDQLLDSAKTFKQSMRVSLNTTMAEATLYNLMIAWGQSVSTLTSAASSSTLEIDGGSLGDAPLERGLIAVGNGTSVSPTDNTYNERTYHAYRVTSVESTSVASRRNEATTIPVSFRALPADTGKYGQVHDRVRSW